MNAQKGVLTYVEVEFPSIIAQARGGSYEPKIVNREPLDKMIENYCKNDESPGVLLYRIEIPIEESLKFYQYCKSNGYSAASLFPGYQGVVKEMSEEELYLKAQKILKS